MKQTDYELSQICTFLGIVFLIWLMYVLAIVGATTYGDTKYLRG